MGRKLREKAAVAFLSVLAVVVAGVPARGAPGEGPEAWASRYDGGRNSDDRAVAVAVSPDGSRLYVTGSSAGNGPLGLSRTAEDFVTVAYEAGTGKPVWTSRYDGPDHLSDTPVALAVSPDGARIYVTGTSFGVGTNRDYATVAYDARTGSLLWASRYDASAWDDAAALAVSPNGRRLYVTGESASTTSFSDTDYATVAYDTDTGALLWESRDGSPAGFLDSPSALAVSPDGRRVYVTGAMTTWYSCQGDVCEYSSGYGTVAYGARTGARLWVSSYGDADQGGRAVALAVSPDGGRLYVTGTRSADDVTADDYATIAYEAKTGGQIWISRYNGPDSGMDWAKSLAVSQDGSRVYVAGTSERDEDPAPISWDYATVAYDAENGGQAWVSRGGATADYYGDALRLAVAGSRVYVTGTTRGVSLLRAAARDYAALAYNGATGDQVWTAHYNSSAPLDAPKNFDDVASALAVSPDGSTIYVTGTSYERQPTLGLSDPSDWTTVAYRADTCAADERGQVSGPVHETVEPASGPAGRFVHPANCRVLVKQGL